MNYGKNILNSYDEGISYEYAQTNSRGLYASTTLIGKNTKPYHGLLVKANIDKVSGCPNPSNMKMLVNNVIETLKYDSNDIKLYTLTTKNEKVEGYKNLSKFRSESNIYTWIYKIAINKIYDFFRKRKIELDINDEILGVDSSSFAESKVILEEKLKLISPKEREIVILKDIYGYKLKEIAEMKDINISTVKSIYYKAIKDMGGN